MTSFEQFVWGNRFLPDVEKLQVSMKQLRAWYEDAYQLELFPTEEMYDSIESIVSEFKDASIRSFRASVKGEDDTHDPDRVYRVKIGELEAYIRQLEQAHNHIQYLERKLKYIAHTAKVTNDGADLRN